jgi:hypothetical protein
MADDERPNTLLDWWREQNRARQGEPSELLKRMRADAERWEKSPHIRELRESIRRLQESTALERLMGRMRPVLPDHDNVSIKRKRKPGAGRRRKPLTPIEERGIAILVKRGRVSVTRAKAILEKAGIRDLSRTTVYERYWKPAFGK